MIFVVFPGAGAADPGDPTKRVGLMERGQLAAPAGSGRTIEGFIPESARRIRNPDLDAPAGRRPAPAGQADGPGFDRIRQWCRLLKSPKIDYTSRFE
jgi:hypothetical protein